jgi:hypothetical protein
MVGVAYLLIFLGVAALLLSIVGHVVSLFMNLFVPARAEARGPIIGGLVFFGIVALLVIILLMTSFDLMGFDEERKKRMIDLLSWGARIFFAVALVSTMAYLAKFMIFMRLHLESSKPITAAGFALLFLAVPLVIDALGPWSLTAIGDWMRYVLAFLAGLAAAACVRVLVLHAMLLGKIRGMIAKYIKEA